MQNVENLLAVASSPLTDGQREQLARVLATSVRADAGELSANTGGADAYRVLGDTMDWPRALAAAQTFLSPAQFAVMKASSLQAELERLMREFSKREGIPLGKN